MLFSAPAITQARRRQAQPLFDFPARPVAGPAGLAFSLMPGTGPWRFSRRSACRFPPVSWDQAWAHIAVLAKGALDVVREEAHVGLVPLPITADHRALPDPLRLHGLQLEAPSLTKRP